MAITHTDRAHLEYCLDLAEQALEAGDQPFGSLLVDEDGTVLLAARNRVGDGDHTQHPEFEIARWAAQNLPAEQRARATVYTSGEHCPMCAAAHAWVGLGAIVYASSGEQLRGWRMEMGLPPSPVAGLSIRQVAPNVPVTGPVPDLAERVRRLHERCHG
ncbi:MAG: nucleoside deaminase [Alcanivorax sp.]|uniref:nucleoside deaminase n=1 Tax=Alloalcanivorax marinus TaxID=1177169 RepID=UPI001EF9903F|nr:nucleoside deaminase [Alloalcanivorax marinus]